MAQRRIKQRLGRFLLLCLSVFWIGGVVYAYQLSPMFPQVNAIDEEETPQSVLEKYQTELSEVYQSYKGTIESYYDVVQNEYLPQLESTYNTHYGAMQSLYDNYDDLTQDILVFSSDMYNECVGGKNELREIYNAAQSRQTVVNKNEVALQDVQKYQTELSEVYNTYKEEIESLDESVQGSYLSQLFDVYNSFNVQLQTLIDNYYVSYSLSDHVNEAAEYCSSGKTELKNIRDNAFETTNPVQNPSISLQEVPFWLHEDGLWGLNAPKNTQVTADWVVGESTGVPYGDSMVNNWADLSGYDKLVVTVTEGAPRILLNRDVDEGSWNDNEEESHLIDNSQGGWSSKYFTQETTTNGDVYTVDLKQIKTDKGFVHLHAIKGASWANVTVTSMMVELDGNPEVVITSSGDGTVDWSIPTGVGVVNANSQSDAISVQYDGELTLTFTPNTGYHLAHVYVNNVDYVNQVFGNALTLNVTQNTAVRAVFATDTNNVQLTADMFYDWDGFGPFAQKTGQTTQVYVVGEPTEVAYGDPNVISYADLSAYSRLEVTVTEGTPRFLFNREYEYGLWCSDETMSHMIEYPNEGWSSKYFSHEGNVWSVDLKQMVADKGYAHLHAIKAPWDTEITVTKMELVENSDVVFPEAYAVPSEGNTTLTFYYDTNKSSHEDAMSVVPFSSSESRGWDSYASNITKVEFDKSFANCLTLTSTANWFSGCNNLTTINGIRYIKTPEVTDMQQMFFSCSSLTSLDLSSFNTAKVSSMLQMFFGCSALTTIYVGSGWNVASLSNAETMFEGCDSLVGGYGTAYDANYIDNSYARIDHGTSNPGYLTGREPLINEMMFAWDDVGAGAQKTSQAYSDYVVGESTDNAFGRANVETNVYVDLSSYSRLEVTTTTGTPRFLLNRDVTDGEPSENEAESHLIDNTHEGCMTWASKYFSSKPIDGGTLWMVNLEQLVQDKGFAHLHAIKGANDANVTVTKMDLVIAQNVAIEPEAYAVWTENYETNPDTGDEFYIQKLTFYYDTNKNSFNGLDNTTVYPIPDGGATHEWGPWCLNFHRVVFDESFALYQPTSTASWFDGMENLTSINGIENLKTDNVTDMNSMFLGCKTLTNIDLSHFNTASVTNMARMFYGCSALETLDMTSFNTSNVMYMGEMFYNCTALKTIYVGSEWTTATLAGSESMFAGCSSLVGGQGTTYDTDHTDASYAHIDGGASNPGYFTDINAVSITDASVIWAFDTSASEEATMKPKEAFTNSVVTIEGGTEQSTAVPTAGDNAGYTFVRFQPIEQNVGMDVSWTANVADGYTFTPNKVSLRMSRFGTDGGMVDLNISNSESVSMNLATGLRPARNNQSQEQDQYGTDEGYTSLFVADIPESFSTSGSLTLTATVSGLSTTKQIGFSDIRFLGVVPMSVQDSVCSAPTFSLDGTILTIQTSTPEAQIYYTLDGTDPTRESSLYTQPVELIQNGVIKAFAVREGWKDSRVSIFTMNLFRVEKPQITVNSNMVSITTTTSGAVIYYTLDGSIPSETSMLYSDPFELPENCIIKAIAKREGYNTSFVASYNNLKHIAGRWDFNLGLSETTKHNLKEDTSGRWTYDASTDRYTCQTMFNNEQLAATVDGEEWIIPESEGLLFYNSSETEGRVIFVENSDNGAYLLMMGNKNITIPEIAVGDSVIISFCTHSKEESRGFEILSDGFVLAGGSTSVSSLERQTVTVYNQSGYKEDLTIEAHGIEIFSIDKVVIDPEAYAVLSGDSTTLTFYYDNQKDSRPNYRLIDDLGWSFTWSAYQETLTTVTFDESFAGYRPTRTSSWFSALHSLTTINGIENLKTDNVTTMSSMFYGCSSLTSIDLSGFNTANVTNMSNLFNSCHELKSINLSGFNTAKVENIAGMFNFCTSLKTIYIDSDWTLTNVTNSEDMFTACYELVGGKGTTYDSNHVDASYAHIDGGASNPGYFTDANLIDLSFIEYNYVLVCDDYTNSGLGERTKGALFGDNHFLDVTGGTVSSSKGQVDLSVLDTLGVNKTPLYVTDYIVSKYGQYGKHYNSLRLKNSQDVISMKVKANTRLMFFIQGNNKSGEEARIPCISKYADLSDPLNSAPTADHPMTVSGYRYDFVVPENMQIYVGSYNGDMFVSYIIAEVDYVAPEPYAVLSEENTKLTFYYDSQKESRGGISFQSGTNVYWPSSITSVTKVSFDESFAGFLPTSTSSWFAGFNSLTSIEGMEYLNTTNVTSMLGMFQNCESLTSLDLSGFNTSKVESMVNMFYGCKNLTSIDMSHFNTASVTSMASMFYGCSSLTSLDLSNFNTANVTEMGSMFAYCSYLSGVDVSSFNTTNVTDMMSMFYFCSSLTNLDVSNFNTANVTEMSSMFADCHSLISLDVSNFNTSKVTDIRWMFKGSSGLKTIYVGSGWSTEAVTEGGDMFAYCTSLVGGKGTVYDADHTDYTYAHIDGGAANPGYLTPQGGYVEAPTFTWNGDNLTMTTGTEGATIYYTMADNSSATTPPTAVQYTSPVAVTNDVLITAYAEKEGMAQSPATVLDYPYTAWKALTDAIAAAQTVSAQAATNDNVSDTQRTELTTLITAAQDAYAERTEAKDAVEQRTATLTAYTQTIQNLVNAENEPYAVMTQTNSTGERFTLTFYYDKKKEERNGFGVGPFDGSQTYRWGGKNPSYIKKIVFDESFDQCTSITSTAYWFRGCSGIFSTDSIVGLQYLHTDNVIDMKYMFEGMYSLAGVLDLSTFNTENVTDMAYMFSRCSTLDGIVVSNFNTAKVTDMKWMFDHMEKITTLDLTSFNTASVTYMDYMFQVCSALETIYIGSAWTTASLVAGGGSSSAGGSMFYNCHKLVGGLGTVYDGNHTNAEYAHIDGGPSNPGYLTLKLAMGDANGDGNINIADAVATVTNILGQPTAEVFYQYAADMNNDKVIDIFDVTMIVNAAFDAASPAPAMTRGSADNIMMEHISMTADADYIYLGIDQPERFTATQFDVTLPEGMELVDARLASATTDHQLSFVKRGENEYRVIGLSMSNATFRSLNGQLIKLEVSGSAVDSDVKVSNVLFVTPTATVITSIDKCLNTAKVADDSFYDLKGQRVSKQQLGKGIYIMNHKKVMIK